MSQCDRKQRRDELLADTQHRVYRTVTSLGGTTINVQNKLPNDKRKQNKTRNWRESTEKNTIVNYSQTHCNTHTSTPTLASCLLNVIAFLSGSEWTSWDVGSRWGRGEQSTIRILTLTHPSDSSPSAAYDKYSCANTICNHSSAAWLCKCHLTPPVRLYTVRFSIWFGTKESGIEGKATDRGSCLLPLVTVLLYV